MSKRDSRVLEGDCLVALRRFDAETFDLAYLDPPFFTNRQHAAVTRDRSQRFSFRDVWDGFDEYVEFLSGRLSEVRRVLKPTGSLFVHCDSNANFVIRALLDSTFGDRQFRSEIVWTYKRWSNSAKGLMPGHQTIFFYSKTDRFKFQKIYGSYSETTNIDQILQLRARDAHGVSTYATDSDGEVVFGGVKQGVPLSDVWEIPFLNPKAKERVGYPTQKPVLLLERIISLCSEPGDIVLDPFCGSGTALVAAALLGRRAVGIDVSREAVALTKQRLVSRVKTHSKLLTKGRQSYLTANEEARAVLSGVDVLLVHRNAGIDAFLKISVGGRMVPVRVQRKEESLSQAAHKLARAARSKRVRLAILVRTHHDEATSDTALVSSIVRVVESTAFGITECAKVLAEAASEEGDFAGRQHEVTEERTRVSQTGS